MNYLLLMLKGFIIGIAKIIPGVSGAVLSISLGIYEKILYIIGHPLKLKLNDIKFLFFLLGGAGLGILLFCNSVKWFLSNYYLPTILLFSGLIIGGMPEITSEIKKKDYSFFNFFIFIISFTLILILTNLSNNGGSSSNHYFLMGVIESLTTIIPGISGTAIFMALGWYKNLLNLFNDLLTFNASLTVSLNFILGFTISTIIIAKVLNFAFKKFKITAYFCVMGFMIGSLWTMVVKVFKYNLNAIQIIFGIILLISGIVSTLKINNFFSKF